MRPSQEFTLHSQGLTLAGKRWGGPNGQAPRLLALHGWLDNAASFVPLAPYLGAWEVVAIDLPGHGLSQHRSADAAYHFIDWVTCIVGILDALAWPHATLIGHSMGAAAAALVAGTVPQRITGLVLLDAVAPYTCEPEAMPDRLVAYLQQERQRSHRPLRPYPDVQAATRSLRRVVPLLSCANAQLLVERNTRPANDGSGVVWRSDARLRGTSVMTLTSAQLHAFLQRIVCPSLFVRAPDGLAWDAAALRRHTACIGPLQTVEIMGGHHVHMEQAAAVAAAMAPVLVACAAAQPVAGAP